MRRLILLIVLLFAGAALAQGQAVPAGTYRGQVTSGGVLAPSMLTFQPEKRGGCYHVIDSTAGPYDGQLSDGESLGGGLYRFTWSDKFGTGSVTFAFKDGGSGFSGKWYFADQLAGVWLGKRAEGEDLPCKTIPVASLD
ncbi:hypothetical protein FFK22_009195 [Mycobacterium sp. KBS0706]|uniref:hypothetical protein n=1 Tax=Mycobacterium sp. KBS0706 TaxID=2578109 RepID=UPI00110F9392|nr:hypothetical protein [Mycobacterium sp. KBS0706]TSD89139.1 hypothetical protein FFK22_009195 [Mycobacterium sp. KBS0706]